jgi:sigma-E factor negative regulatory protein RseB
LTQTIRRISCALILLMVNASAFAANTIDAREWLERMTSAMTKMSYQGTFVYSQGGSLETMRITHLVDEDGVHERLYSINGPHREVIRDNTGVRCILGDPNAVMEDRAITGAFFPVIPEEVLSNENAQYKFKIGSFNRVAGQVAKKISIIPVDEYRYGYELWLDQFSGLLLKWVLYDSERKPIAKLMFTELNLGDDILLEELKSNTPFEDFVKLESGMPESELLSKSTLEWKPATLPPGFKLSNHSVQEEKGENVFEHQVYSDGLASVSVYIENAKPDSGSEQGVSKLGTANAFSRSLGTKQVTVIGEVPSVTVQAIAQAVMAPTSNQ